jgi:hypothetical protein
VVSVKVVVAMLPPDAPLAAVIVELSVMAWWVKLGEDPMMEFIIGLPAPVERSYH